MASFFVVVVSSCCFMLPILFMLFHGPHLAQSSVLPNCYWLKLPSIFPFTYSQILLPKQIWSQWLQQNKKTNNNKKTQHNNFHFRSLLWVLTLYIPFSRLLTSLFLSHKLFMAWNFQFLQAVTLTRSWCLAIENLSLIPDELDKSKQGSRFWHSFNILPAYNPITSLEQEYQQKLEDKRMSSQKRSMSYTKGKREGQCLAA